MRFSWIGLTLAPLLAPLVFSVLLAVFTEGAHPALKFLILMIPSSVISYGVTICLFLPALFLLSLWRPVTGLGACLLGLTLGAAAFFPVTFMAWTSSGPDSGPPTESFFSFLARWATDLLNAIYPTSGLLTAALYWGLGTWITSPARSHDKPG
jgi:hypothetical protein